MKRTPKSIAKINGAIAKMNSSADVLLSLFIAKENIMAKKMR